jgi:DNA-binding response OmpR family regulator
VDMNDARILLVIENSCTIKLLSELFVAAGARVLGTSSSEQGLRGNHLLRPDLVIIDLELAGLGRRGIDTHVGFPPNTPIIFLTPLRKEYYSACGLDLDGAECFIKPFSVDALLGRVQELLHQGTLAGDREPWSRTRSKSPANTMRTLSLSFRAGRVADSSATARLPATMGL